MTSDAHIVVGGQSGQSITHPSKLIRQGWATPEQTHVHALHRRVKSPPASGDVLDRVIETSPSSIYDSLQIRPRNVVLLPPSLVELEGPTCPSSAHAATASPLLAAVPAPTPIVAAKFDLHPGQEKFHSLFIKAVPAASIMCIIYLSFMWEQFVVWVFHFVGAPMA